MRRFDLNLLYTLRELLKEPNTTKVGEKLGLTQSAVSASLNRLRWAFKDELLVRSGRAMTPTKRAEQLLAPVDEILTLIEKLVEEVRFEPAKMERTFRITSAEFMLAKILPDIVARCHKEAPGVIVKCEAATAETRARMRSGHIDLAVGPLAPMEENATQISHHSLYRDKLLCVASKESSWIQKRLSSAEYIAARHAIYRPDTSRTDVISAAEQVTKDLGLQLNIGCEVTSYAVLPGAIINSDMIATIPSRILDLMPEHSSFHVMEMPFDLPDFEVSMIWNSAFDGDAEHQWMRNLVAQQF